MEHVEQWADAVSAIMYGMIGLEPLSHPAPTLG